MDWWKENRKEVKGMVDGFCEVLDELEIPVSKECCLWHEVGF